MFYRLPCHWCRQARTFAGRVKLAYRLSYVRLLDLAWREKNQGNRIRMMASLVGLVSQYLLSFAAVYGATVVIYFATGIGMTFINRRHPERRIQ